MRARLIGLGGRLRAGKDEVAGYLAREHGFKVLGMSDALHEAMLALDPIVGQWDNSAGGCDDRYSDVVADLGYVEAKKHPEVRRLLQNLGTEVGRNMIGENVWVNIMARKIDDHLYADQSVVVTGIRFPNELTMIHQFAGRAVWVERPTLGDSAASSHASENGVSGEMFDEVILNDGSLQDLYTRAATLA